MFTLWTNERNSNRIRAFKSALVLRNKEEWHWVEKSEGAFLWVIDAKIELNPSDREIYKKSNPKPHVAIIDAKSNELPQSWGRFTSPMNVKTIFNFLDEILQSQQLVKTLTEKKEIGASAGICDVDVAEPWRKYSFKLSAWPNISQYREEPRVVLTCACLLANFYDFESALQWGLDEAVLEKILDDAYQKSLLKINTEQVSVSIEENELDKGFADKNKNQSLIQKLLNRFR